MLWIAFRLYLWNIDFSNLIEPRTPNTVVNCFQIVSLKYWFQQKNPVPPTEGCCELLSDCIFEILISAGLIKGSSFAVLWIAFRLYLWNIDFSTPFKVLWQRLVVNCFQIVSLKYWFQQSFQSPFATSSCELLSDCIFEILISAYQSALNI